MQAANAFPEGTATMADEDEIILSELSDDELVLQMHDDLYDGLKEEIEEGVNILIERGWAPYDVLTKALVAGMTIVGNDFRDGILFVPEVLLSANAMKAGMSILKPLLAETGAPRMGKMVIGTVKGDIHDIGKNLVAMMMEGAGFEVVDLGIEDLELPGIGADLILGQPRPALVGQGAQRHIAQPVAGRADLGKDLQPTLELHLVIGAEGAFMREIEVLDMAGLARREGRPRRERDRSGGAEKDLAEHRHLSFRVTRPAWPRGPCRNGR